MRKSLITVAVLGALSAPSFVFAAEKETKSDFETSGSVGLFSQYIFRGLTQTNRDPALQGNFDINHSSGLYLGAWASNVSWPRDTIAGTTPYSSGGSLEIDIYGGFKTDLGKSGFGIDLGALQYYYPGTENPSSLNYFGNPKLNTTELYGAINYHWVQAKISGVVSKDAWGFGKYGDGTGNDANGTYYAELNANVPIGEYMGGPKGLTGIFHIARQDFKGAINEAASYNDWRLGLQNAFDNGIVVGAYYTDTNIKDTNGLWLYNGKNIGDSTGTAFIQKTF
jgi:uncharacterized protein (TIGR02001 family)